MKSLGQEFKEFILRGNVVSLAVAVIIGTAFTAIVTAFSEFIIMPIIAAIGGQPDFSSIGFDINGSTIGIGSFLNAVISFLIGYTVSSGETAMSDLMETTRWRTSEFVALRRA